MAMLNKQMVIHTNPHYSQASPMLGSCCHGMPWHQSDDTRLDGHRWACHQCHNVGPMTVLRATTHERWRNMLGKANNKPSPIFRLTRKFCIYAYITFYHHQVVQGKKVVILFLGMTMDTNEDDCFWWGKKPYNFEDLLSAPTKWSNETCKNYATLGALHWARHAPKLEHGSMYIIYIMIITHINGNFRIQKWRYCTIFQKSAGVQREFQDPKMELRQYHIRPYFVGIFPYIGLKHWPYIW